MTELKLKKYIIPGIIFIFAVSFILYISFFNKKSVVPNSETFFSMDTVMTVSGYCDKDVLAEAEALVTHLDSLFSVTNPESDIYILNNEKCVIAHPETFELISDAVSLCERTHGTADISVYPLVCAWGFTTGDYKVPSDNEISEILAYVDYKKISLNNDTHEITIPGGMMLDLGSIAKGYASDCLVNLLKENSVESALINLGGNVYALGEKKDGTLWNVGIADPTDSESTIGYVSVSDKAVITSGGYERYFEKNGKTYIHIIDPATGVPVSNDLKSVTIVGDTGVVCDAFSTALFVMGSEKAIDFWQSSGDFEAIFIKNDGEIIITEDLSKNFTLQKDVSVRVIYK